MKHIVLFYYILSFASGFLGILVSFLLFLKTQRKEMVYHIVFLVLLFLLVLTDSFYYYFVTFISATSIKAEIAFTLAMFICKASFVYMIPYLVHHLAGTVFGKAKTAIFSALSLSSILFIIFPLFISGSYEQTLHVLSFELYSIYMYAFFAVIIYSTVYLAIHLRTLQDPLSRKIAKTVFVLGILCFPIFLFDSFWILFQLRSRIIPRYINLTPVFFFIWNLLTTIYGTRYLLGIPGFGNIAPVIIPDSFIDQFHITDREKQIIALALDGFSHQEISNKIFVSPGTVRNYLYSIYKKTGVNNKLSLVQLMQKKEQP